MPLLSSANIPYEEYRAIAQLRRAHPELHEGTLRAMIAFGDLVATGGGQEINILEVVEGWEGPRHARFDTTAGMPLRGRLNLYFLTPDEFERPSRTAVPGEPWSSLDLLELASEAYAILLEDPAGYAVDTMAGLERAESRLHRRASLSPEPLSS